MFKLSVSILSGIVFLFLFSILISELLPSNDVRSSSAYQQTIQNCDDPASCFDQLKAQIIQNQQQTSRMITTLTNQINILRTIIKQSLTIQPTRKPQENEDRVAIVTDIQDQEEAEQDSVPSVHETTPSSPVSVTSISPEAETILDTIQDIETICRQRDQERRQWFVDSAVLSIAFSNDGTKFISGTREHYSSLYNVDDGTLIYSWDHDGPVTTVDFSSDDQWVAIGVGNGRHNDGIFIYALASGRQRQYWSLDHEITSLTFHPYHPWVIVGSKDSSLRIYNILTGQRIKEWSQEEAIWSVQVSHHGDYILTGSVDATVHLYNLTTDQRHYTWYQEAPVWLVAFSPDDRMILVGDDTNQVFLYNTETTQEMHTWQYDQSVQSVVFSLQDNKMAMSIGDGSVRLYNVDQTSELYRWQHDSVVNTIAFSPDGQTLMTGGKDGMIHLYNIPSDTCLGFAARTE